MKFPEIIYELNQIIRDSDSILNKLQKARAEKRGLRIISKKFFGDDQKIISQDYAYHYGGSDEFQFNIGQELDYNFGPVFRFGLAFNFQPSRTVKDPIGIQLKQVERFNELVKKYPKYLSDSLFWIWESKERTNSVAVRKILNSDVKFGNFIFIGSFLAKKAKDITKRDLEKIVDELEHLFPVYEYVQLGLDSAIRLDKVARICYNNEGWIKPSGAVGKSKNPNTHESDFGFGYEEWLFDFSKLENGFHYGFLEPIYKYPKKYEGEIFNINLFTIDAISKKRYWVGKINDLEVIGIEENKRIKKIYKDKGWYEEMENQLSDLSIDPSKLGVWTSGEWLFNVKFKPENLSLNPIEVDRNDPAIPSARYTLLNFRNLPENLSEENLDSFPSPQQSDPAPKFAKTSTRTSGPRISEIPHLHNRIAESLYKFLKKKGLKVEWERSSPSGGKIDMISWHEKKATFFEIKTYPNAKACIREGLGQVLEYSLYPNQERAERLVIVSQNKALKADKEYIKHLKETLNINLEYWCFNYEKIEVTETIK